MLRQGVILHHRQQAALGTGTASSAAQHAWIHNNKPGGPCTWIHRTARKRTTMTVMAVAMKQRQVSSLFQRVLISTAHTRWTSCRPELCLDYACCQLGVAASPESHNSCLACCSLGV